MLKLKRVFDRPVLEPISGNKWESRAVLNPAVIRVNNEVHVYYRAVEGDNFSSIGYAKFDLEGNLIYRHNNPVLKREFPEESHGVEDPRIVFFEGNYYMFYVAYDGNTTKVGIAKTQDLVNFTKLGFIKLNKFDKDAFIFPERINGNIIYVHRIDPDIQYAYFNSIEELLNYSEEEWDEYIKNIDKYTILRPKYNWENMKIGGGVPPIKTDFGWLFIYHGVEKLNDKNDRIYRAGVALLDLEDPAKVIGRLDYPILEPQMEWEIKGDVNNVVFPTGHYIYNDAIYVFYGCADKVIGLAYAKISDYYDAFFVNLS